MKKIVLVFLVMLCVLSGVMPVAAQSDAAALKASAAKAANLRAGPGTSYAVIGGLKAKEEFEITARNADGNWFQIKKKDGTTGWVAAFLVKNPPATDKVPLATDIPVPAAAPTKAAASAAAAPAAAPVTAPEFGVSKQCGHFEYKLYDLRKVKSVWFYNKEYLAQGNFLLVFIEVKNISPGTSYLAQFGPRLLVNVPGQRKIRVYDSFAGGFYAGWMYQTGSFYDDLNPGAILGEVEAYDLPIDSDFNLVFDMRDCPGQSISLGNWSAITKGSKK